jgi:hypothetical protein
VSASFVQQTLENTQEKLDDKLEGDKEGEEMADKLLSDASKIASPENIKKNALYSIFANILTLAGAFLMFRLNKTGFWLYLAGTIVSIIAPMVIYGTSNLLSLGMSVIFGIIGVVFVVLYALNLKQMK